MISSLTAILGLAAVALIAAGVGDLIGRGDRAQWRSASERFVFGSALGLGAIAYAVFSLGLVGLLRPMPIAGIIAVAGVVSYRRIAFFVRACGSGLAAATSVLRRPLALLLLLALVTIAVCALISALAPPSAKDWDGLAYHLAIPKLFLQAHRIHYIAFSSHSNFPFTMEMLYTIGLAFDSTGLARAFNWWTGVLCCLGVYWLARRHLSTGSGCDSGGLAALIFAGLPIVGWEATTSYIDLGAAMFALLAAYAILNFTETRERYWLLISAALVGLSAGTKMTSLSLIGLFSVWIMVEMFMRDRRLRRAILSGAGYGVLALAIASPWYIKSIVYTGNPVFPFFYSIFGGHGWNEQLARIYRGSQMQFGIGTDPISLLKVPYALAFRPDRFYDTPDFMVSIGFVLIAVIPIAFRYSAFRIPHSAFSYPRLLAICIAQIAIWCFMTQQSRYLMPALAMLSPVAAYAILRLSPSAMLRYTLLGIVGLQFALAGVIRYTMAYLDAPVVLDSQSQEGYLNRTLDIYPAIRMANSDLPKNAKLVLFGDTRGFYLDREYFWGDAIHNNLIPYPSLGSPRDLARRLRGMGVTHALVNHKYLGGSPWAPSQASALVRGAIDEGYFEPVYLEQSRGVGLYKIVTVPRRRAY